VRLINAAVQPEDLMFEKVVIVGEGAIHADGDGGGAAAPTASEFVPASYGISFQPLTYAAI
jgi:hypothetical protein